jgi:nicotinamidase-related amidase
MTGLLPSPATPLIVIDLQNAMFDGLVEPPIFESDRLIGRVNAILHKARGDGRPIAFIRHDGPAGDAFAPGEPGWPVASALGQLSTEPTFGKSVGDAFTNPDLGTWLDGLQARNVVLVGAQTNFCVAATVNGAILRGLAVTVVSDAHSTLDLPDEPAQAIIDRYNAQFAEAGVTLVPSEALS